MCQDCSVQKYKVIVTEHNLILLTLFSEYLLPLLIPSYCRLIALPSD